MHVVVVVFVAAAAAADSIFEEVSTRLRRFSALVGARARVATNWRHGGHDGSYLLATTVVMHVRSNSIDFPRLATVCRSTEKGPKSASNIHYLWL